MSGKNRYFQLLSCFLFVCFSFCISRNNITIACKLHPKSCAWPIRPQMIPALPTWLLSSQIVFISILKDFFLCVSHLSALSLGRCCILFLEYTAPFYLLMWISMFWFESYRNSYAISFGKKDSLEARHSISQDCMKSRVIGPWEQLA